MFARSCEDLRLLLDVFDPDVRSPGHRSRCPCVERGLSDGAWARADAATRAALADATARLEGAGAKVVALEAPSTFDALAAMHLTIMRAEGRAPLHARRPGRTGAKRPRGGHGSTAA